MKLELPDRRSLAALAALFGYASAAMAEAAWRFRVSPYIWFAVLEAFGVASDHLYEFSANMGYQWTKALGTGVGYRKFDVDYDHKDYLYDVKQQGWQVGLTWAF